MAKARRKATPKQMAALKKARAALTKKYGTADISKITARRGSGKKRSPRRAAAATAANPTLENKAPAVAAAEEETMQLEENPKGKKKAAKKKKKKAAKKKATRRAAPKAARKPARRRPAAAAAPAAPKKKKKRKKRATQSSISGKVHVVRLPRAPQIKVIRIEEKKKRKRRKKKSSAPSLGQWGPGGMGRPMMENPSFMENPYQELFENAEGAYSMSSLKSFGWAAGGVALGLTVARGIDRVVATRAPAKSGNMDGNNPWYGRDAAAAMHRRPDAMRMGVQGLGALASIGGAYMLRNRRIAPWMLGGIALGFGSNLLLQVVEWMILPRFFKVEKADEATWANRLYPVEQIDTQDTIDGYFEKWDTIPSLAEGQLNPPKIQGVLSTDVSGAAGSIYTLGEAGAYPLSGAVGHGLIPTGRVGNCQRCGGNGGCFPGCQSMGGGCQNGGPRRLCEYIVQAGDNLDALLAAANVPISAINALNASSRGQYWVPGSKVILPFELCMFIDGGGVPVPNQPPPSFGIPVQPPGFMDPGVTIPMGSAGPGSAPGDSRAGPGSAPVPTGPLFREVATLPTNVVLSVNGIPESRVYVPNDSVEKEDD